MARILNLGQTVLGGFKNNEPSIKLRALIWSPFGSFLRLTCKQVPYCDLIKTKVILFLLIIRL